MTPKEYIAKIEEPYAAEVVGRMFQKIEELIPSVTVEESEGPWDEVVSHRFQIDELVPDSYIKDPLKAQLDHYAAAFAHHLVHLNGCRHAITLNVHPKTQPKFAMDILGDTPLRSYTFEWYMRPA